MTDALKAVRPVRPSASSPRDVAPENPPDLLARDEIARLAYHLWLERGSPEGSAEQDWYEAEKTLVPHGTS